MIMTTRMDFFFLAQLMAFEKPDHDSIVAICREAYRALPHADYLAFQEDLRIMLKLEDIE